MRKKTRGPIIVNAGAKSHVKRWPFERFANLCDRIIRELKADVYLIGTDNGMDNADNDRVVIDKVIGAMEEDSVDLVGKTTIGELFHIVRNAECIITNDSAPLHLASALNVPTIALFGPTDERKYGPLSKKSKVIRRNIACSPCEQAQCEHNYECLRGIDVDEVLKEVKNICGY